MVNNRAYSKGKEFTKDCKRVGIKPTKRQSSRYRMKKGFLYKTLIKGMKDLHLPYEARIIENE